MRYRAIINHKRKTLDQGYPIILKSRKIQRIGEFQFFVTE
jgi:hypothetical protein